jgi:hypothetical protein
MVPRVRRTITSVGDLTASRKGVRFQLGDDNYRGTEASWAEAGSPTALVVAGASERELFIEVSVLASDPNFVEARAENLLDNEHPDVNSDGMQIHLLSAGRTASWLMVPEPGSTAVRTSLRDEAAAIPLDASWRRTTTGWELLARIDRAALASPLSLDVIVNQMPRWRERRRGQLVMSGSRGESAYLRGDRQDRDHLVPMVIRDD